MEFTQNARHRNWSTERKNRAREGAERLGDVQTLAEAVACKLYPWFAGAVVLVGLGTVGGLESR